MFYSTRHFFRLVIILILVLLIVRFLPQALSEAKVFINFIISQGSKLIGNIKM